MLTTETDRAATGAPAGESVPHEEWQALLRGYEQIRGLTPAELRAIPALATLRAVWTMAPPAAPDTRWGRSGCSILRVHPGHLAMIDRLAHGVTR